MTSQITVLGVSRSARQGITVVGGVRSLTVQGPTGATGPQGPQGEAGSATATVKRLTSADSPYAAAAGDEVLFCDTDTGAIAVTLPVGAAGNHKRVINTGSGSLTVSPSGAELLYGASAPQSVALGVPLDLHYESAEGWW